MTKDEAKNISRKENIVLVGGYLPGIYPPGEDDVVSRLLSTAFLKASADDDPEIAAKYDIHIIDVPTTSDPSEIAKQICEFEPVIVAYSVYMWNYDITVKTLEKIKEAAPGIRVIMGGPLVSYTSKEFLRDHLLVDVIVCGSGESRFKELLKCDFGEEALSQIPKITYRSNKQIVHTSGEVNEDLTKIPSPYQKKIYDLEDGNRHTVFVETYRGCPFECGYCIWGEPDVSLYKFPIDQILQDIEIIYNSPNVETVIFADACLFYTRERAKLICEKIASCSQQIPTVLTLDILVLNEEMIRSLQTINLMHGSFHFGLQSTNQRALELLKRKSGPDIFKRRIDLLREMAPDAEVSFDLIYGLPGDNYQGFRESVNFALSLSPSKLYLSPLLLLPGTPFWDDKERHGFVYDNKPPYMVYANNEFSSEDMAKTFRLVLWVLVILYFPAIRDAICRIPKYNPKYSFIELVDMFVERLKVKVDPISNYDFDFTIASNNKARRHVMDTFTEPENSRHVFESMMKILEFCEAETLVKDIKIGVDYYKKLSEGDTLQDHNSSIEGRGDFGEGIYEKEKIQYVKSTWVKA